MPYSRYICSSQLMRSDLEVPLPDARADGLGGQAQPIAQLGDRLARGVRLGGVVRQPGDADHPRVAPLRPADGMHVARLALRRDQIEFDVDGLPAADSALERRQPAIARRRVVQAHEGAHVGLDHRLEPMDLECLVGPVHLAGIDVVLPRADTPELPGLAHQLAFDALAFACAAPQRHVLQHQRGSQTRIGHDILRKGLQLHPQPAAIAHRQLQCRQRLARGQRIGHAGPLGACHRDIDHVEQIRAGARRIQRRQRLQGRVVGPHHRAIARQHHDAQPRAPQHAGQHGLEPRYGRGVSGRLGHGPCEGAAPADGALIGCGAA